MSPENVWLIIGFGGQALFASRFLIQWIYSEKKGKSVIPVTFWYLSLSGGLTLFAYAIHHRQPTAGADRDDLLTRSAGRIFHGTADP